MEITTLGRSGLHITRPCLGAMMFGHSSSAPTDEHESRRIIDAFLDAGGNFIDTANVYVGGESEEVVGRAIKARRDDVVLATKGFGPIGPGPNDSGLGRKYLTRALEGSLRRLDTDYIDLYQCHRPDQDTPVEETMATLHTFVLAGKVRYLGCSNWTGSQIVEAQSAAARDRVDPLHQPPAPLLAHQPADRGGRAAHVPASWPGDDGLQPARRRGPDRQIPAGPYPAGW